MQLEYGHYTVSQDPPLAQRGRVYIILETLDNVAQYQAYRIEGFPTSCGVCSRIQCLHKDLGMPTVCKGLGLGHPLAPTPRV